MLIANHYTNIRACDCETWFGLPIQMKWLQVGAVMRKISHLQKRKQQIIFSTEKLKGISNLFAK